MRRYWSQTSRSFTICLATSAGLLCGIAALLVVVLSGASSAQTTATPADASVHYFASIPTGYATASGAASAPHGKGVYVFAESDKRFTLFYRSEKARADATYNIPHRRSLLAGYVTPIVVSPSGDVWIGINKSLVRVNPRTRAVRVINLPSVPVVARGVERTPAKSPQAARAYEDIESMAISVGGDLYVGRLFASRVQVVSSSSGQVTSVALPQDTALAGTGNGSDLARLPDGEMSVALYLATAAKHGTVLDAIAGSHWRAIGLPCGTLQAVAAGTSRSFVAVGFHCASKLTAAEGNNIRAALVRPNNVEGPSHVALSGVSAAVSPRCEILGDARGADLVRSGQTHQLTVATTTDDSVNSIGPGPQPTVTDTTTAPTTTTGTASTSTSVNSIGPGPQPTVTDTTTGTATHKTQKKVVALSPWLLAVGTASKVWVIPNDEQRIGVINLSDCG